ncbi:efflux RND transporter periplasmic adaptor subunit [Oxalobacteraceae bacterium OM1]|nr:efflux RND transporter periplasmic adaptor subunit [Oxalobacteraceae bacterium OM1]
MNKGIAVVTVAVVAAGAAAWYFLKNEQHGAPSQAQGAQGAATVTVASARRMDVPVRLQANGYVSSLNSVDVRPQVSNVVAKVHIKEGQFVKAGDLLFTLDDRADRVNLQKAEAQLAKDQATLADLQRQLARSRELLSKGFIAQSATDTVQAQFDAQHAAVASSRAAVDAARVQLGYDTIRATSSGRAGAIAVYSGTLVQPTSAPMVTISQLDPIAVSFTLPESELNALLAAQKSGDTTVAANIADGKAPLAGKLSFIDNAVDTQNGTVKVKAAFPNAEQRLWPGQYVTVSTVVRELKDAVVIPQASIITGIDNKTVYVVGGDKSAQQRRIEVLYAFGEQAAVTGVQAGDPVVVDGKQNLRPGAKVREQGAPADGNGKGGKGGQGGKGQSAVAQKSTS